MMKSPSRNLIKELFAACKNGDEDLAMEIRAALKGRFRISDDQIHARFFRQLRDSKIKPVSKSFDSVDLKRVESLSYLLDGWIPECDVSLLYAEKSTGKTTLALAMCLALAKAEPFLDRTNPPDPVRSMFIATDSGLTPLKNAIWQLEWILMIRFLPLCIKIK